LIPLDILVVLNGIQAAQDERLACGRLHTEDWRRLANARRLKAPGQIEEEETGIQSGAASPAASRSPSVARSTTRDIESASQANYDRQDAEHLTGP
jgi:hypothetical protein